MTFLRIYLFITYEEDTKSFHLQRALELLYFSSVSLSCKQFYGSKAALILVGWIRIRSGNTDQNPRSRRAKMAHKNGKRLRKLMCWVFSVES